MNYIISKSEREIVISCIARAIHSDLKFIAVNDILKMLQSLDPSKDKKEK